MGQICDRCLSFCVLVVARFKKVTQCYWARPFGVSWGRPGKPPLHAEGTQEVHQVEELWAVLAWARGASWRAGELPVES